MAVINLKGTITAKSELSADITVIYNFALQHMKAAIEFAKLAKKVECDNASKKCGSFFEEIRTYVSSAIILSVCALEANINEHLVSSDGILKHYSDDERAQIFNIIQYLKIKEKYQYGLIVNKKSQLKFDKEPFESFKYLISFRNSLVHYKPESDKDLSSSKKLEKKLRSKIQQSPFFPKGDCFITKRAMSYSCAKWAVNKALNFSKKYSKALGIPDRFSYLKPLR